MIRKFSLAKGMFSTKISLAKGIRSKTGAAHPLSKTFRSTPNRVRYQDLKCLICTKFQSHHPLAPLMHWNATMRDSRSRTSGPGLGRVHKSWVQVWVRVLCLAWVRVRVLKKCVSTSTSTLVWVRVWVLHIQGTKFMSTSPTFFRNNLLSNFAGISGPLY